MCHSPVLRHGEDSTVQLKLRIQGGADWAWRGCVAPRQAECEVLGGNKKGAELDEGKSGYLDNEEDGSVTKPSLSVITGPEPATPVSVTVEEAGKRSLSPHPGSTTIVPVPGVVRGVVSAW